MKVRYLKFTFKSGRTAVDMWEVITLEMKGSSLILIKGRRMSGQIYIDEVLQSFDLFFYEVCTMKRGVTI